MTLFYSKLKDEKTKEYTVINQEEAKELGWEQNDLDTGWDGNFYLNEHAPKKPALTYEEIKQIRRQLYIAQKDPITCQIQSLKDEEQTEEVIAEIKALMQERSELVAKIKEENPYPTEE